MPNSQRTIRVLLVDDDELVGQIVRITLKHANGFEWLGQVHSAEAIDEIAARDCPDVVLLDLCMPGKSPFLAIAELRQRCPKARVAIFSGRCGHSLVDRAIEAGAWGYISKDSDGWSILADIRRVAAGEFVLSPDVRAECACLT